MGHLPTKDKDLIDKGVVGGFRVSVTSGLLSKERYEKGGVSPSPTRRLLRYRVTSTQRDNY